MVRLIYRYIIYLRSLKISVMLWKGFLKMINVSTIINNTKKDFTRDRASVINDFLAKNNDVVILSYIKKSRGDSIKFYYIEDGKKITSDYVLKNAKILINALLKNDTKIYVHNGGKITPYKDQF